MIPTAERKQIIDLIKREVVPAIGCTEPIAVALCVARATETLGCCPEKITARLSANILKNAMGVGIPGTGMIGLPIAIALGALIGKSDYQLEVLRDCNDAAVERGKQFIAENRIGIELKKNISEKLYIEIEVTAGSNTALAVISGGHTTFTYISLNDKVIMEKTATSSADESNENVKLCMRKIFDFATTAPLEEIDFILESKRLNKAAAEKSFKGEYGHCLGRTIMNNSVNVLGNCELAHILAYTSAACDARMAGAMIPVMSNSGSGNQGITATLPVVIYGEDNNVTDEQMIRALTLSHLTVIYIKQSLGRLSALCGCVVASTGAGCGITYLMGGDYDAVAHTVQNMVANLTGMICDGAKPSCSLKLTSGVSTAVMSAMLSMNKRYVTSLEGIICDDVDKSILNLTSIGREAMTDTDAAILKMMTCK